MKRLFYINKQKIKIIMKTFRRIAFPDLLRLLNLRVKLTQIMA